MTADLGAAEAADLIARRELSPEELAAACLERAAACAELGAFVALDGAAVLAQARRLARAPEPRGPLHGVPVAVKDVIDVEGLPTRAGSGLTPAAAARRDAAPVAALRAAGALILGKTATHELAFGTTTPGTANPWDPSRVAGGSSGGSAVAVAVGAALLALGTDTAGSVRIPAACCGVTGLTARPGRLDTTGVIGLAPPFDALGLLARTPEDVALGWAVLAGPVGAAPVRSAPAGPVGAAPVRSAPAGPAGPAPAPGERWRVALADPSALGPVEDAWALAAAEVAGVLAGADRAPATATLRPFADWGRPRAAVVGALALAATRAAGWWPARADEYGADVRALLELAEATPDSAVERGRAELTALADGLRDALRDVDVLVLPTLPGAPPRREPSEPPERFELRAAGRLTRLCAPFNAAGLAAVSVPAGADADGLPVGVQLVARDERLVLAAAEAWIAAHGAPPRPPSCDGRGAPA